MQRMRKPLNLLQHSPLTAEVCREEENCMALMLGYYEGISAAVLEPFL